MPADYIVKLCLREKSGLVGCDMEQLDSMAPLLTDPPHANLTHLQIPQLAQHHFTLYNTS